MLDLAILAVVAVGLARGFATGAVRQVAGLVGFVVAFVLAVQLMGVVGAVAAGSLGVSDRVAPLVGFVLVLLVVHLVVFALVRMAEAVLGALRLTVVNRALGGVAGAFKAALLLSAVFLALSYLRLPGPDARSDSALYAPVSGVLPVAWDAVAGAFPRVERLSVRFGEHVRDEIDRRVDPAG